MRSIVKFSTKLSLAAFTVILGMSSVMANTLSEVEISAQDTGYGIVLKTDEAAQMKKIISSDNKMTIELKDVEVSPDLNTVYNNAENIDNVTISPASKGDIKIVFKGEGISNSRVSFESAKNIIPALNQNKSSQSIQLSGPVSSYTPVYNPEAFAQDSEDSQTSNPQLNEVLTKMHVTRSMLVTAKKYAKKAIHKVESGDINFATVFGVILVIAAFMLKPRRKSAPEQRPQSLTGILSNKSPQMQREIGLNREMTSNMNLGAGRAASLNSNALKTGYGMRAYQQSQKNPYMSNTTSNGVSGIARRKPLQSAAPVKRQTTSNRPVSLNMNVPIKSNRPAMTSPVASKTIPSAKSKAAMEPSDLDSMKFLESITKIYEKNGRTDLAKGLKDNLRKAQMSGHAAM
ncbi:MAG TPA: AMIN domain-containing protein [Candidatus Limenecus avicola]|jgi:hypothetical protein|uniref:AMIN domain-containing protein n=1 Tax=Candidatus Limenecus avicola TaxID=2840847 RepID=A0A9D1SR93_9CLOT|nr:AMIN domain-containing protein [Candidatus Limenecus avicola]